MNKYLNIGGDIETIPTQCEEKILSIKTRAEAKSISPPAGYTKADYGRDLGLDEKVVSSMKSDGLKAMWVDKYRVSAVEEEFEKLYRATSFSAASGGEVVSASFKIFGEDECGNKYMDEPVSVFRYNGEGSASEFDILSRISKWLDGVNNFAMERNLKPRLVGANIRLFDARFLAQRCMILGVKVPDMLKIGSGYNMDKYFDIIDAWSFQDKTSRQSLDSICRALNIETPKNDELGKIDGSMVWDIWRDDGIEGAQRIANYNARDTCVLEPIFEIVSQLE